MVMRHLLVLVVAVACAACAACGAPTPSSAHRPAVAADADARAFGLRLLDVLERDDLLGFRDLLSARMQHRKRDSADLLQMFAAWRRLLVPYAKSLRDADWTLAYNDVRPGNVVRFRTIGGAPEPLARVVEERGKLRIDEN